MSRASLFPAALALVLSACSPHLLPFEPTANGGPSNSSWVELRGTVVTADDGGLSLILNEGGSQPEPREPREPRPEDQLQQTTTIRLTGDAAEGLRDLIGADVIVAGTWESSDTFNVVTFQRYQPAAM